MAKTRSRPPSLAAAVQKDVSATKLTRGKSVCYQALEGSVLPEEFLEAFMFKGADQFEVESIRDACIENVLDDSLWGTDGQVDFLVEGQSCFKMRCKRAMQASPAVCAKSWFEAFKDDAKLKKLYPDFIPGTRKILEVLDDTAMVVSCSVDFGGNFCQLAYLVAMKEDEDGRAMVLIESVEHPEGKFIAMGGGQSLVSHFGVVFAPVQGKPQQSQAVAGENAKVTAGGKVVGDQTQVAIAKDKLECSFLKRLEVAEQLVRDGSALSCFAGCNQCTAM
eukprot:TRINITY_DN108219_c0_g1_i1.p1 TRINITY_DN108219_c0_g1~~TRINITY_DN108219_c0_g1_i1.p1  ORF type:complete len:292 (+),score=63.21 TRINITY_DN108219_c0_g1_i1:46-876(+)